MKIVELISKLTSASMIEIRSTYGLLKEKKAIYFIQWIMVVKIHFKKKLLSMIFIMNKYLTLCGNIFSYGSLSYRFWCKGGVISSQNCSFLNVGTDCSWIFFSLQFPPPLSDRSYNFN